LNIRQAPIILPFRTPLRKVPEKFVSEAKSRGVDGLLRKFVATLRIRDIPFGPVVTLGPIPLGAIDGSLPKKSF